MDEMQIEKIQGEVKETFEEVSDLNEKIEAFLDTNPDGDVETDDVLDVEDTKDFEQTLDELDEQLNDALLEFVPKEEE